jgi:hypothetical protein
MSHIDLTGKRFGRLIITGLSHFHQTRKRMTVWDCICDCGNKTKVARMELVRGDTVSCGCRRKEIFRTKKHGLTEHPLYQVWADMKTRCFCPTSFNYADYGGRGISVCNEWRSDFIVFYNWGINNGYKAGLQLDRYPNNDGNYEPNNCRWATSRQNRNNTRTTRRAEINGVTKTASEWAEETGININCISERIRSGLNGYEAVYGKPRQKKYKKHMNLYPK